MNFEILFYVGMSFLLFATVIAAIFNKNKNSRKISLIIFSIGLLFLLYLSIAVLKKDVPISLNLSLLNNNIFVFEILIDRLAAFFILIISVVSIPILIYSWSYIDHLSGSERRKNILVALMMLYLSALLIIVISANLLLFLFFWEIMALTSFFMVYYDYDKIETRKAGRYYFIMTSLSTTFLILAFIILYISTGSMTISAVTSLNSGQATLIFMFLFLGFGIKSGIIPFHKWLPYAHPAAPSNISALMSGLMIKIGIYGLIRFVIFVLPEYQLWWGILILIFGSISALLGVIYALKEHDIKRLLAYHSIENIGIILIGFGLHIIFSFYDLTTLATLSLGGALLHTLNHALFKSSLFLTAGSVVYSTKTKNIEEMGGLIKTMPITAILFLIGAVAISALPPLNGFVSEFMIFQSFFSGHLVENPFIQIILIAGVSIFALTSALAATCFVKAFGIIFLGVPRSEHAKNAKEVPKSMLIGPAILSILCIFIGVFSFQIATFFGLSFDIPNMFYIGLFLIVLFIPLWLILYNTNKIRVYETWGCGYCLDDGKTEYTASGFSQPIIRIFSPIFRPKTFVEKKFSDIHKIKLEEGHVRVELLKLFEERIYNPIVLLFDNVSGFMLRFHQKDMDSYIAYVFIVCLVLMIVIGVL